MKPKVLQKYLSAYAEPLAGHFFEQIDRFIPHAYEHVVCIPAYDESPDFIAPLLNGINADVLVILVFNCPQGTNVSSETNLSLRGLRALTTNRDQITLQTWNDSVDVLAVDCCTVGRQLPPKEGVGLARKIAGDLAIAAIAANKISSPWLYCTDADVQLPADYFTAIPRENNGGVAAMLYPFVHEPAHDNILQYEISLRYYVLQLERMGSPYAFQTVGSSMAAHAQAYVSVRGFPKRSAAEDFYILNKLAKTGPMVRLQSQPLTLSSRRSHRVPFGTGAAMNKLHADPVQRLYHPDIFKSLGEWYQQIDRLWEKREDFQHLGLQQWWVKYPLSNQNILPTLITQGLPKVLGKAFQQCQDLEHFQFYLHVWFDAFRTLRFIHLMRDRGYESILIEELPQAVPELNLKGKNLNQINLELTQLESRLSPAIGPTQFL